MKPKHLIIAFALLITGLTNYAQHNQILSENPQPVPFQKLYLHTDREFYFSGDTLWFAAYLLQGETHEFEKQACNLYVDIINAGGEIISDELFILQNGSCSGYFALTDSMLLEGNYLLRAYTDYLKNFGDDAFFTKIVQVSRVKSSVELADEKESSVTDPSTALRMKEKPVETGGTIVDENLPDKTIDVSFLPEGGFLLAKESNGVAFKAINKSGKGIDISGVILDDNKNRVLTFQSIYKGAGKFFFYPKAGKKYVAKINGYQQEFPLPEIQESGAKIKLINQEANRIQLLVHEKNMNRSFPFYLQCLHRGKVLSELEITRKEVNTILRLSPQNLGAGINSFVLLDKNKNPLSERLIFRSDNSICQFDVRLNDEAFSTREEVQINLKAGNNWPNEITQLSVAVIDENYINAAGVSQNIASYLLVDSELKGHIDSPADYLISNDSLSAQTKLDLLMCTNGWRNYIWNSLDSDSIKTAFKPQLGFTFNGHVKRSFGKKSLTEGDVSMIVFKSDSSKQLVDNPLDSLGNFSFQNIVFYDSASVFVQGRNKKNKNTVELEMELPKIIPPEINSTNLNQLNSFSDIPYSVYRQRYLNEMRLKEFYPDKNNIILEDIEVKAKKPRPKFKTGLPKKNDGPFLLTWEMTAGRFDIVEYLAYNVPGIHSFRTETGELMIKLLLGIDIGVPGFFIDGYNYYSIDEIKGFNVSDFRTIEIVTPPMSYSYGARAISGAVILTFRRGDEIDSTRPLLGGTVEKVRGFTPYREFYSPRYTPENINSEAPDYRNTLYWNPKVTVTSSEQELYFNTSDNLSRYKVFVEGVTESGQICVGMGEFVVDKILDK